MQDCFKGETCALVADDDAQKEEGLAGQVFGVLSLFLMARHYA